MQGPDAVEQQGDPPSRTPEPTPEPAPAEPAAPADSADAGRPTPYEGYQPV